MANYTTGICFAHTWGNCPDKRSPLAFPPMTSKTISRREPTHEDREAAHAFASALEASGKSQEELGGEIGVSAGLIGHWKSAFKQIPAERAREVAAAIGANPFEISVQFRKAVGVPEELLGIYPADKASQPRRLTGPTVTVAYKALNIFLSRRPPFSQLNLEDSQDAELLLEVCRIYLAMPSGSNDLEFGGQVVDLLQRREALRDGQHRNPQTASSSGTKARTKPTSSKA